MSVEYTTPPSRIVWGHPSKPKPVIDDTTKTQKIDKLGNPRFAIEFGIAVPKDQASDMLAAMGAAAAEHFPNGFPQTFAWKYKDGDTGVDGKGNPLNAKEGHAGSYILACKTELVASVKNFEYDYSAATWRECPDIKCGDWVNVKINFDAHKARTNTEKAGLYVNPVAVMLHARDKAIAGGSFDPNAAGFAPPPPQAPPANAPPPPGYQTTATGHPGAGQLPRPSASQPQHPQAPQPPAPNAPPHTAFLQGPRPD